MNLSAVISSISWQEWLAVIFSLLQVIFAYKNNPINYLFGLCGITLTIIVLFQVDLFAEVSVNVYYFIMSVYGWIMWSRKSNKKVYPITFSVRKDYTVAGAITILSFLIIYFIIKTFTDSNVVFWDSIVAAFAYGGMYLMAKRKIENWIFLNISNAIAIPLLVFKELYLFSGLTIVLFIIAIFGYLKWKKLASV